MAALLAAACSAAPPASLPAPATDETPAEPPQAEPAKARLPLSEACSGRFKQGGLILCQRDPGDAVAFGETVLNAWPDGSVQFGLARDAAPVLAVTSGDDTHVLDIALRNDPSRSVTGLDCDKVDARTAAQKAHAADSWERKQAAFGTLSPGPGALNGFAAPSTWPASSPFGPERRYTGISKTSGKTCDSVLVHYGADYAAPPGSTVTAPAAGIITLAEPDLYYEGGTVFLDHGHGLLSILMHLSDVSVSAGDRVAAGDVIARSGSTGRSSGPHLHWAVKWRNPDSADRSGDYYIDPALLLDLPVPAPE